MRNFRLVTGLVALIAAFAQADSASAVLVTVANYQDDWQGISPATGWRYMTNSLGAIGTAANYTNMVSNPAGTQYNLTGSATLPVGSSYASLNKTSGHPGTGTSEVAGVDRYVIAAYTLQASDIGNFHVNGPFLLSDTSIYRTNSGTNVLALRVYVDNDLIGAAQLISGQTVTTFNRNLGNLEVGDTVYVAVGPNNTHGNDSFNTFNFTIQFEGLPPAPEPSSALLLGLGMVGLVKIRRRKAAHRAVRA